MQQQIIYIPSNRQKKELLIRHRPLRLYLPLSGSIGNALAWARSVLPVDLRERVSQAEECEIQVMPLVNRKAAAATLTELLGHIVNADSGNAEMLKITMVVVDVLLAPAVAQRHTELPAQWPSNVMINGKKLFEGIAEND